MEEKKKEKFWRDVKVYDARDLEEWLEQTPAVGAWLAKHIEKYPQQNVYTLEEWWHEWTLVTRPPLPPELVLAGRDEQIEKVKKWLNSEPLTFSSAGFNRSFQTCNHYLQKQFVINN